MFLSTLELRVNHVLGGGRARSAAPAVTHLLWFCDGLLLFFLISWFGTSVLTLDNDFYYAVFIWTALTFLFVYVRTTKTPVGAFVRTRWPSSVFVGVLASIYIVVNVWNANPTQRPGGLLLIFEVVWRGVAYGIVESLVLTAFPLAVAVGIVDRLAAAGLKRRVGISLLTIVLVWVMSTTYHLGFVQFDRDDVVTPQLATTAVSLPAAMTANPIGSVIAHVSFNVAATIRTFESDLFVPPEVEFIPDYEPPGVFGPR